jgi:hypothetical protein
MGQSRYQSSPRGLDTELVIDLDEPMPATSSRLQGHVVIRGRSVQLPPATGKTTHVWTPQTLHAQGEAHLSYGGAEHQLKGSAYVDSNISAQPLHAQGIESWRWGRVSFTDYTLVYYDVEESDGSRLRYLYRQGQDGALERVRGRLNFGQFKRGTYGLSAPKSASIIGKTERVLIENTFTVEDGPFYQRSLSRAVDENGNEGLGVSEVVVPDQVDKPWQRPLVRMRTHTVGGSNSPFLALFNGPRANRNQRLLRSLLSAGSWS